MRRSRLIALSALLAAALLLVAGVQVLGSAHAARRTTPAAPTLHAELAPLERMLAAPAPLPRAVPVPRLLPTTPGGAPCYVGPGRCSETPCIEFAGAAPAVLKLGGTVNRYVAPAAGPRGCPGRLGAPKTLRVSAP